MKRGLVLAKYDTQAATTRQRFVQAVPYLREAGIEIDICPLFSNAYLAQLFTHGTRSKRGIVAAYWARLGVLMRASRYDFIWVQYELFPYLHAGFERLISLAGKPVIYDMDDALFHQYDQHNNPWVRKLLGNKLQPLLRRSALACCGNAYLAAYAKQFCAHTEIMPTVVDITHYRVVKKPATPTPTLGWIGSPSTWRYTAPLRGMLGEFVAEKKLNILVVGAGAAADNTDPFAFRDWQEAREVADIQQMDIGIMPLPDEPWARGKCGYKLIQYMACGIPVIASPVGVNREIVEHGVNGFLASTDQEWREAIATLSSDAALRQRMGHAGRARVEAQYSIQHYGPRLAQWIAAVC